MDSQTLNFIAFVFTIIGVLYLFSTLNKIKQLLFGIMFLLNEQRKDEGKESNLQDIYNKGKNL
ncbi:MAG: hypothetical protein IM571_07930 [Chitinophagaceae bacterium]|jgi:hypothetical protein|nr:hypothetical protein [Chitinophagaceae bacterium]